MHIRYGRILIAGGTQLPGCRGLYRVSLVRHVGVSWNGGLVSLGSFLTPLR